MRRVFNDAELPASITCPRPVFPNLSSASTFLVTVDRDCRTIFAVTRGESPCREVARLDQRMEPSLETSLTDDARKWNRGLKTLRRVPGGFVLCDVFGVYLLNDRFEIIRYLSIPRFTDIHDATPIGEDVLLITNTGADQVLWCNWNGDILESIDLHRWFPATPWMEHDLAVIREKRGGDLRLMPLDWARESCHVNWAEQTPLGTMLSCFIQGEIIFFNYGKPTLTVPASAKCHAPRYLGKSETLLISASEENRIMEVDLKGREVWSMDGFKFPKYADLLEDGNIIVADTGNRRVVEIEKKSRRVVWECAIPGTPYYLEPWEGIA